MQESTSVGKPIGGDACSEAFGYEQRVSIAINASMNSIIGRWCAYHKAAKTVHNQHVPGMPS